MGTAQHPHRPARGMEVGMPDGALPGWLDREASPSLPYPTPNGDPA